MRLKSDLKINIRNTIIGASNLLICVPLVAAGKTELIKEAQNALRHKPDLLEWRVDRFDSRGDCDASLDALSTLRRVLGDLPLIFTCRNHVEGGLAILSDNKRESLITAAIQTGHADIIDIELSNDETFIQNIQKAVKDSGLRMILSYHNFEATPKQDFLIKMLFQALDIGADIAKVAVMPQDFKDVLTLMSAALKARKNGLKIPMIAISMGTLGSLTRFAAELFGSDITFASSDSASAPGQISIQDLRRSLNALYSN